MSSIDGVPGSCTRHSGDMMKKIVVPVIVVVFGATLFCWLGLWSPGRSLPEVSFPAGVVVNYEYDYTGSGSYTGMGMNSAYNITTTGLIEAQKLLSKDSGIALGITARGLVISTDQRTDNVPVAVPLVAYIGHNGRIESFEVNAHAPPVLSDHLKTFISELQLLTPGNNEEPVLMDDSLGSVRVVFQRGDDPQEVTRTKLEYLQLGGAGFGVHDSAVIEKSSLRTVVAVDGFWLESASGTELVRITKNAGHTIQLQSSYSLRKIESRLASNEQTPSEFLAFHDEALKNYETILAEEIVSSTAAGSATDQSEQLTGESP